MLEGKRGQALSAPTVVTSTLRPDLVGRRRECELLEKLLESARAGRGAVLVVHGEPGVGKTALLDYVVQRGTAFGSPGRWASKGRSNSHSRRFSSWAHPSP